MQEFESPLSKKVKEVHVTKAPPERIQASKAGGGCSQIFLSNISKFKRLNIREKGV